MAELHSMLHVDNTRLLSAQSASEKPGLSLSAPPETALARLSDISSTRLPAVRIRPSTGTPWLTPLLTTLVVVMGFALFVQHFSPKAEAQSNIAAVSTEPVPVKPSPLPVSAVEETPYPFAEFVKVSGVRVVMDLNHRAQVQYLVVNHSDTPLTDIGLKIAVRPAAPGSRSDPLFTVAVRVPMLGPHESKEIRTDLDSDLRADVQVTSQQ